MSMDTTERWAKNRETAELLGWRVEERAIDANGTYYVLIDPMGKEVVGDSRQQMLEAHFASNSREETWQLAPDFFGSLDAVADALPATCTLSTYPHIHSPFAGFIDDTTEEEYSWFGLGATRQEAAGNALLDYARAKKEPTP